MKTTECRGKCGATVSTPESVKSRVGGSAWCRRCFDLLTNRETFLARVSDVLRRAGTEDAEILAGGVERLGRIAVAGGIPGRGRGGVIIKRHICETPSEALAMHIAEQTIENEPTVTGAPADWEG